MLTDRWSEIDRLFQSALDVPPDERESFLAKACPADTQVRNEVRSLILRYDRDGGRLENTLVAASAMVRLLAHPELRPGQRISKYEVLSSLGSGGMAEVYLARDTALARNVALKVLSKGLVDSAGGLEPVFAEARAASSLNHPNIITVFDAGEAEGRQFIAAEHVVGETIRARLQEGPVALHEGLAIAVQIARALSAAHAARVVHRDVKPENIMLRPDGVVKVLDFGIARVRGPDPTASHPSISRASFAGQPSIPAGVGSSLQAGLGKSSVETGPEPIVGSLAYMSPEQALGMPIDSRSDIFSFGTLLFELFTGSRPFSGSSNLSTLMAVVGHPAVFPASPRLPGKLRRIIQRCLEKNPGDRPQNMEEVALVLEKLRADKQPGVVRKRRILWASGAAGLLLLAGGAFWWVSRPSTGQSSYIERQITNDKQYKDPVIAASGSAVYFHEVIDWQPSTVKLSLGDGELRVLDFPGAGPGAVTDIEDATPSGDLLYRAWSADYASGTYHIFNEDDSTDYKIPGVFGYSGSWSPDGNRFAFYSHPPTGLYIAGRTGPAKLITEFRTPGPWRRTIAWSPDGRTLRFVRNSRLYEVAVDGTNPHPVFDSASTPQGAGVWTQDGARFIYCDDWTGEIWSVSQGHGLLARQEFTHVTSGPILFGTPALGANGRIYAVGQIKKGRLNYYDAGSGEWRQALGGLSIDGIDYSRDGRLIAFVGVPRREIAVRRAEGGGRVEITTPGMRGYLPRFSPDGTKVAFMGKAPGEDWHIYICGVDGSGLHPLDTPGETPEEPNWSPDGSKIIYGTIPWDASAGTSRLYEYELASGRITTVPGSEGLFSPRWSPDGKMLAVNRFRSYGMNPFVLLDRATGKRTEFPENMRGVLPIWSHDSRYLYFLSKTPLSGAKVFKLSIDDHSVELVARFQNRIIANGPLPSLDSLWMGLMPDDSPLLLEDVGSREIYEISQGVRNRAEGQQYYPRQ